MKLKILLSVATICFSSLALAQSAKAGAKIQSLSQGEYEVQKGSHELCLPLNVGPSTGAEVYIKLSPSLGVPTAATKKPEVTKSEVNLEANCRSVYEVKRYDDKSQTVISETKKEVCDRKIRSETLTRFTFKPGSVRMDVEEKGASGFKCLWKVSGN